MENRLSDPFTFRAFGWHVAGRVARKAADHGNHIARNSDEKDLHNQASAELFS
jgi:hypothetical protein